MKILVTGATGLIGTRLCLRLFREGHDLVVLSRHPEETVRDFPVPCEAYAWNATAMPEAKAFAGAEAVIHLAGEGVADARWTAERKQKILESRTLGTRHLVEGIRKHGGGRIRTLLGASAVGFYGDRGDELLDETSAPGAGFLAEICQAWEKELFAAEGLRTVSLRTGVVLATEGGALAKLLPVFRTGAGGPIGSGRQWMSWIHLDDLVALYVHALTNESIRGPLDAVSSAPVTNAEFSRVLAEVLHRPAFLPVPAFALKLALGEMSQVVLASQRVTARRAEKTGFHAKYPELRAALSDLLAPEGDPSIEELRTEQWVPRPISEVFPFFSEARNLEDITPPWLGFHVERTSTPEIGDGTEIDYRLKVHGLPMRWTSRIEEWVPGERFVDTQVSGPYAYWHHLHGFEAARGGTWLTDRVRFKLPLGAMGDVVAGAKVRRDVREIFGFRRRRINERFAR